MPASPCPWKSILFSGSGESTCFGDERQRTTYERAKKIEKNAKANGPDVVLARKGHKADATTSLNASERPLHDYFGEVSERADVRVGLPLRIGSLLAAVAFLYPGLAVLFVMHMCQGRRTRPSCTQLGLLSSVSLSAALIRKAIPTNVAIRIAG